jgi:hypothetical protein
MDRTRSELIASKLRVGVCALRRFGTIVFLAFCILLNSSSQADAYSLLTHEQLIDLTWQDSIVPLLLSRYPTLTPAQLDEARAYAYGGCVIQDIGYYPFGDINFSDLTHYVRSGDFVVNLFRNAKNADELAFAVGALSHYIGDSVGHPQATNVAVPVEFPKLEAKYGPVVNYAQGKHPHVQTEFAFDINEVEHHRMAPLHFLRHIGLGVPLDQVALAYYETYGVKEDFSKHRGRRINVRAYRFAVRAFIPRIAYAVAILHRRHMLADPGTPEGLEIQTEAAAVATENNWQAYRRKAGIGTYTLAGLLFVLPKFGPLKMVDIKGPTAQTEADYMHSMALSTEALRGALARLTPRGARRPSAGIVGVKVTADQLADARTALANPTAQNTPGAPRAAIDPRHPLPNRDLDTGKVVQPGGYSLTDSTYAQLLHTLTRQPTEPIPPGIKDDIQAYYANPDLPITTKNDPQKWAEVQADLETLKTMPTSKELPVLPTYDDGGTGSR